MGSEMCIRDRFTSSSWPLSLLRSSAAPLSRVRSSLPLSPAPEQLVDMPDLFSGDERTRGNRRRQLRRERRSRGGLAQGAVRPLALSTAHCVSASEEEEWARSVLLTRIELTLLSSVGATSSSCLRRVRPTSVSLMFRRRKSLIPFRPFCRSDSCPVCQGSSHQRQCVEFGRPCGDTPRSHRPRPRSRRPKRLPQRRVQERLDRP